MNRIVAPEKLVQEPCSREQGGVTLGHPNGAELYTPILVS